MNKDITIHNVDKQIEVINSALLWAEKYRPNTFQFDELKKHRRKLKKIRFALAENCSAAAFGESQVGKSYVMSSLLSTEKSQFRVSDGKEGSYSFIDELNPSGGKNSKKESTGVITRFSTNCTNDKMKSFVRIRTLSIVDLVLMLTDSYYKDVKIDPKNVLDKDIINEHVENIRNTMVDLSYNQEYITEDDIYDIQDYIENIVGAIASNVGHSKIWGGIAPVIQHVKIDDWGCVFSLLWNGNEVVTQKFKDIISQYSKLNFHSEIYVPFDAVLRKKGTLLDIGWVDVFCGIDNNVKNEVITTDVYDVSGKLLAHQFMKSYLSVLIAELTFIIPNEVAEEKPFLKDMDLLDFPGLRRRENVPEENIEKEMHNILRRGKVAYLFNKYSRSLRINSVLFCQHADMNGQSEIGEFLNAWISENIGRNPTERSEYINTTAKVSPFFIISTKFNVDLQWTKEKKGDDLKQKWYDRFDQTLSLETIKTKSYGWFENWVEISEGYKSPKFQNIFMLRDFFWSKNQQIFEGFDEEKNIPEQAEIKPAGYPDYREDLKRSFIEYPFVIDHFENPETTWEESATAGNDGSKAIIAKLNVIAPAINDARQKKYKKEMEDAMSDVKHRLEGFSIPEDDEERKKHTQRIIGNIRRSMDYMFGSNPALLGKVTDHLMIPPEVIRNEVYNVLVRHTDKPVDRAPINVYRMNAGILPDDDKETCLRKLLDQYKCSEKELREDLTNKGLNLDDVIAGEGELLTTMHAVIEKHIREVWSRYLHQAFQDFESVFQNSDQILFMYDALYDNVNMGKRLCDCIEEYLEKYQPKEMLPTVISDATSLILNNFVNQVGQDLLTQEQKTDVDTKAEILDIQLDQNNSSQPQSRPSLVEALQAFDKSSDLVSKSSLTKDEVSELRRLPWWNNFQKWRDDLVRGLILTSNVAYYNEEENDALKEILNQL